MQGLWLQEEMDNIPDPKNDQWFGYGIESIAYHFPVIFFFFGFADSSVAS